MKFKKYTDSISVQVTSVLVTIEIFKLKFAPILCLHF